LGQKKREEQLYRPSGKSKFHLCIDKQTKDWILAVTDAGYVGIFSKAGERLSEHNFEHRHDDWEVQYFEFSTNLKIIALTDKTAALTYLYDTQGRTIADAIQSSKAVEIRFNPQENELIIYRTFLKMVGSLSFKLR
jgi:hypothetical protein